MKVIPPKFWTDLFRRFCDAELYEELQGDLEEKFYEHLKDYGAKKAKALYRLEVLKMIRPSVIRTPKLMMNLSHLSLFRIHLKLCVRNLTRNKVFSAVTTAGFAAAISISLFLINLIYSGYSIDQQHDHLDRIYRVATKVTEEGGVKRYASVPFELKARVEEQVPGFELLTHVNRTFSVSFQRNDSPITLNGIYVDSAFFRIFNFPVIKGNINDIFRDRNSVIITEEVAEKLFNGQNPIGQVTNQGQVVRAVIASPKNKSHIGFEAIGNIDTLAPPLNKWAYRDRNYLYGRISPNADQETLEARLTALSDNIDKGAKAANTDQTFFLQSITGIMFKDAVFNEIGSSVGREGLIIFSALTVLLMAMSCFNYTNLSIARALQRTKEVGIRKVVGSTPMQIVSQFLIETFLFSGIGFVLGLGIYVYYSTRIGGLIPFPFLEISDYQVILLFAGFAVVVGCTAGLFPALFFSRISPLALFSKQSANGKLSLKGLRKILVGVQLTVSMFCIILLSLIIDQNRSLKNSPTGIQSDQLLVVSSTPETVELLIPEFEKIPGIAGSTVVSSMPVVDYPNYTNIIKDDMADSISTRFIKVDANFDEVFRPQLKLGSFFTAQNNKQSYLDAVVSDALLAKMSIPENEALGTVLRGEEIDYRITGVLSQTISANPLIKQDESMLLVNSRQNMDFGRLVLRIQGQDSDHTLSQIEAVWEGVFTDGNFQAVTLESQIDSAFKDMLNAIRIITFIGGCIILISILGQLGMALFNAQSRVKEIGIRKVMGAAIGRIMRLILKSTTNTILVAVLVATPLAYLVFVNLVAAEVRNPLNITPWVLLKGALILTLLVIGVIISQTWRVVNLNPAKSLRDE